jgi:aminoglycoside phosphotransferase (APT) family kinase protein
MDVNRYRQRLNLPHSTFVRIVHDDAMIAIVYKITRSTGEPLILKICPRAEDYQREVYFLRYFANKIPVPRIVQEILPEEGLDGAILMEYLPGVLLKITDFTDALAYEIGSLLARIHLNRVAGYGDLTQMDRLTLDPSAYFTLKFEEELEECSHHLPKGLIEQCRSYYDTHIHLVTAVDGPCMVHRDFRPGNLIVFNGKLQGIIDWAGGRGGFAEQDFCSMEHWEWSLHPETRKSFLAGYASIRSVPHYGPMMPLLRLSKAIGVIGFTVKSRTWENSNARVYKFNRTFLETFF